MRLTFHVLLLGLVSALSAKSIDGDGWRLVLPYGWTITEAGAGAADGEQTWRIESLNGHAVALVEAPAGTSGGPQEALAADYAVFEELNDDPEIVEEDELPGGAWLMRMGSGGAMNYYGQAVRCFVVGGGRYLKVSWAWSPGQGEEHELALLRQLRIADAPVAVLPGEPPQVAAMTSAESSRPSSQSLAEVTQAYATIDRVNDETAQQLRENAVEARRKNEAVDARLRRELALLGQGALEQEPGAPRAEWPKPTAEMRAQFEEAVAAHAAGHWPEAQMAWAQLIEMDIAAAKTSGDPGLLTGKLPAGVSRRQARYGYPGHYVMLAQAFLAAGDRRTALGFVEEALLGRWHERPVYSPEAYAPLHLVRIQLLMESGKAEDTKAALLEAKAVAATFDLGAFRAKAEQAGAEFYQAEAISREIEHLPLNLYLLRAQFHLMQRQPAEAEAILKEAVTAQPAVGPLWAALAELLRGNGKMAEARSAAERAESLGVPVKLDLRDESRLRAEAAKPTPPAAPARRAR